MGGAKPRALVACLLLEHGQVVSTERLVDALWDSEPPDTARAVIQTYVSVLRRTFAVAGKIIVTKPPGYLIEPVATDLAEFEQLTELGRRRAGQGDHKAAARSLRAALELWRGPALEGIGQALRPEAARLDETRLAVLHDRIAADLACGDQAGLVGELTGPVAAQPTSEPLRSYLMTALYRLGRQADALAVYDQGRQVLADELGIDPGPELRRLHGAILRADSVLDTRQASTSARRPVVRLTIRLTAQRCSTGNS